MPINKMLEQAARAMMAQATPEQKQTAQNHWIRLTPQNKMEVQKSGIEPGPFWYFYEMAKLRAQNMNMNRQMGNQGGIPGQPNQQAMNQAMNLQPNMQGMMPGQMQGQDIGAILRQNQGLQFNVGQNGGMGNPAMNQMNNLLMQNRANGQMMQNGMVPNNGMNGMQQHIAQQQIQQQQRQMHQNRPAAAIMANMGQPGVNLMGSMPATPQQQVAKPQQMGMAGQVQNPMGQMGNQPTQQQMMIRNRELPQNLNPTLRQMLMQMPEPDYRTKLEQMKAQAAQRNFMNQANQQNMNGQQQMPGMQQQVGMGQPGQQQMQNGMAGGMMQNQSPMGQIRPQGAMGLNPAVKAGLERLDMEDFPRSLLNNIQVPDMVKTWSQLKQYVESQANFPAKVQDILRIQLQYLVQQNNAQNHPAQMAQGMGAAQGRPAINLTAQEAMQAATIPVTVQEMQNFKIKYAPLVAQLGSDDTLRQFIQASKFKQIQAQRANNPHAIMQPGQVPQQVPQPQRPMPMQQNVRPTQPSPAPQQPPQSTNMRKRPSSEANEEPRMPQRMTPQTPNTAIKQDPANAAPQRTGPPAQNTAFDLNNRMVPVVQAVRGEVGTELDRRPPINLEQQPDLKAKYQTALAGLQLHVLDSNIKNSFALSQNVEQLKQNMRDRFIVTLSLSDPKQGILRQEVKVDLNTFTASANRLKAVVAMSGQRQNQPAPSPGSGGSAQTKPGTKPPPAPTAGPGQKAFFPASHLSPQGVPKYFDNGKPPLGEMKMPPSKKQKKNSASTPTHASTSPPSKQTSRPTPETKAAEPPRLIFKCDQQGCEFAARGFATADELQMHKNEMHTVLPEDGLKFSIDTLNNALGLDADGKRNTSPESKAKGLPKAQAVANLKGGKPQKSAGPTSAPKDDDVQPDSAWADSSISMDDFTKLFSHPEPFSSVDANLKNGLDTSPAALTPSSSRTSSTDVAEHSNINVKISYGSNDAAPSSLAEADSAPHIVDADNWLDDLLNFESSANATTDLDLLDTSMDGSTSKTVTEGGAEKDVADTNAAFDAFLDTALDPNPKDEPSSMGTFDLNMDSLFAGDSNVFMDGITNEHGDTMMNLNDFESIFGDAKDENSIEGWQ
jgi:hypothetical protein